MLFKIALLLTIAQSSFWATTAALPAEFFSSLNARINILRPYQTKVQEEIFNISIEVDELIAVYSILDSLETTDNKEEISQELLDQMKELRTKCAALISTFQKAHNEVIFKHSVLERRDQQYQSAVLEAARKPLPDSLNLISNQLKSKLSELAQIVFDKSSINELKRKVFQQKDLEKEVSKLKAQQKTLLNCLGSCKKSFFISKKSAELGAQITTLESFAKKLELERKTFLNRYGAASLDTSTQILNAKQDLLYTEVVALTALKKVEYQKFIKIDFETLTTEQANIFYAAKKCIENYGVILEGLINLLESCRF